MTVWTSNSSPRTEQGATYLYGERDFAGVIKLRILKWEDTLGLLGWALWKNKGPYK